MAMSKCKECGKSISTLAKTCPHCGVPKPVKKIPIWLGESDNKLMVKEIVKNADVYNSMPCNLNVFKKISNNIASSFFLMLLS